MEYLLGPPDHHNCLGATLRLPYPFRCLSSLSFLDSGELYCSIDIPEYLDLLVH